LDLHTVDVREVVYIRRRGDVATLGFSRERTGVPTGISGWHQPGGFNRVKAFAGP